MTVIISTSDVNKAFLTTHEYNEFDKTGKLYYLIILLILIHLIITI